MLQRQLMVLQCQVRGRVQFTNSDRTETPMRPILSRRLLASLAGAVAATVLAGTASAQEDATSYPSKPIRIVVGFAAGGGNDLVARIVGPKALGDRRPAGHHREPARGGRAARGHLRAEPARRRLYDHCRRNRAARDRDRDLSQPAVPPDQDAGAAHLARLVLAGDRRLHAARNQFA